MHRGYIKLYRAIADNKMWEHKPFERARAWIDMLMLTNYKDGQIRVRGIPVDIKRGQLGWSIKRLSDRWGWSEGKVKRFFKELESDRQIEEQNGEQNIKLTSLITIINYDKYQSNEEENDIETEKRQRTDEEETETNKKDKKLKKEKIYFENDTLHVPLEEREYFKKAFPLKNVDEEIGKMERWLIANPAKRKKQYKKFMNSWLERAKGEEHKHYNAAGMELEYLD